MTNKEAVHILRNTAWLGSNKDREKVEEAIETLAVNTEQPQYEELTPEEAAPEIASGSIFYAGFWLDIMIRLKNFGYAICRKR